jgi:excinuclease UvrABC ATPase subunit
MRIVRARTNNLKNVTVEIPKRQIVVFTGVSGSGKSSLLFDTIAAESQRQLAETYSTFVRHRLLGYPAPDADRLENLPASIVIDQRRLGGSARSTVGTATEIYALLRLLYSRTGKPHIGESSVFSFNNSDGMCATCEGLGTVDSIDESALFDRNLSLDEGAIRFPGFEPGSWRWKRYVLSGFFDPAKALKDFTADEWRLLTVESGTPVTLPKPGWAKSTEYEGVLPRLRRSFMHRDADDLSTEERNALARIVISGLCPECHGTRLNSRVLSCRIADKNIADCASMEPSELIAFLSGIDNLEMRTVVAATVEKLQSMIEIGLDYLTLDRGTAGLSGGESQRIKMIRHLGSSLADIAYILDEPSVGLHARDVHQLGELLTKLRNKGNSVLVVEHDPDVITIAEHVIDMGPGAGAHGGEVVYQGSVAGLAKANTATARGLQALRDINREPRTPSGSIEIRKQSLFNVRNLSADIPLGVMTVVAGVAGSGKSTLVDRILPRIEPKIVRIDQSALNGSSRSTPATYLGILDPIRRRFASASGKPVSLFSSNALGACPTCKGIGVVKTDLAFLDSIETPCEDCGGSGYSAEARTVRYKGHSIAEVMSIRVPDAQDVFREDAPIASALLRLDRVGLAYMTLGQRLSTLSGGERQRLKLATELVRAGHIYVFDEPTTGLHMLDVDRLIALFNSLVEGGDTVIIVEHNLDVIAAADHIIEMGPGAGRRGGQIIFSGTATALLEARNSVTAPFLRRHLERHQMTAEGRAAMSN